MSYHQRIDCQHTNGIFLWFWQYDTLNYWKIKETCKQVGARSEN